MTTELIKKTSLTLSILLLLFATNAWAEVKTLNCEVEVKEEDLTVLGKYFASINYDLNLKNAEVKISNSENDTIIEEIYVLQVAPTKLTFTNLKEDAQLVINRQDLGITFRGKLSRRMVPTAGKCQIVRAKKNRI